MTYITIRHFQTINHLLRAAKGGLRIIRCTCDRQPDIYNMRRTIITI